MAPYFVEEIRKYLESTYGTEAVHERGLRVYTTLNVLMQRAANRAVYDGLHAYERRHGWRGQLRNIAAKTPADLDAYQDPDWRAPIEKGDYLNALVVSAADKIRRAATRPIPRHARRPPILPGPAVSANQLLKPGDVALVHVADISGATAKVQLEQDPGPQAALIGHRQRLRRSQGHGRRLQLPRFQVQSRHAGPAPGRQLLQGLRLCRRASSRASRRSIPSSTRRYTVISGGQPYSPHNYDERFEGNITLRRALVDSRNVPAIKLSERIGINSVVEMARRFGITSPLPPYLPIVLGAADLNLMEHTSAFTVFPDDGIRIDPHMIRRVTTYDGAVLEQTRPDIRDVIAPDVARTMVAMLEDVINIGTGQRAKALMRPAGGKTGTTNNFTDAWFMGFTPQLTAGVWVGFDDKAISLGKGETGARAALPIWIEFMQGALQGLPVEGFPNVESLAKEAAARQVRVDTPDDAPEGAAEEPHRPATPEDQPAAPPAPAAALPLDTTP